MTKAAADTTVNPHYLDHLAASAASHEVEVTEDIVGGKGVKLLAKGSRAEADVQQRLLAHKLSRPLEQCLGIADGIAGGQITAWPSC